MGNSTYEDLYEFSSSQTRVMQFIQWWVREKKTTCPLKQIIISMKEKGMGKETTIYSLKILVKDGYIRRSGEISNKTSFVQLRTI